MEHIVLGQQPHLDEPYYVGFNLGGYELGLDPDGDPNLGCVTYWAVDNIEDAMGVLMGGGAQPHRHISDVGEGIGAASVLSPTGDVVGVIENRNFQGT